MSKLKFLLPILVLALTVSGVYGAYKPTNLDTKTSPAEVTYEIADPSDMEKLFENERFSYYFRDDRDVMAVVDKRNGYTWKTGLDIASSKEVKAALRKGEPLGYEPLEEKMNQTFTGIANSLIVIEYYDKSNNIKRLASAGQDAESRLMSVTGEEGHYILEVKGIEMDINLSAHLYLTEEGYNIRIQDEDITGEDTDVMAAVLLNPFLGASGGRYQLYDAETGKHGDKIDKPDIPGYVLVPDGSGALIRFEDYNVSLKTYESKVYGGDPSTETYNYSNVIDSFKPFKEPLMPLYGIAHGDRQAAFIGYAEQGDDHMEILVVPEENTTLYTWAYPRFVYKKLYYQVFNKRGEGYFTLFDQPASFDIDFNYEFLAGGGETGYAADYAGMALTYRDHLLASGVLELQETFKDTMPMRLDFIMSDQKKSVVGYENAVITDVSDVEAILEDLTESGEYNINVGLYGWQDGGITVSQPWKTDFTREIGSKRAFEQLIHDSAERGIDVSFVTDYVNINEEQVGYVGNAAKHVNKWYLNKRLWTDVPFDQFSYARPDKSAQWLETQVDRLEKLNIASHTVEGISGIMLSNHGNEALSVSEAIALYQKTFDSLDDGMKMNMKTPNQYLWAYTDRFLQAPVYPTQFLIETDTVPFLQMVLNGTMEVYGPYANFSFSGQRDMLRMIDYNLYPSFVLTSGASYLLSSTNSLDYYSTEYDQYESVIRQVYDTVSSALDRVIGLKWTDRFVPAEGIVINTYEDGTQIIINYTDDIYNHDGIEVGPLSYMVLGQEG